MTKNFIFVHFFPPSSVIISCSDCILRFFSLQLLKEIILFPFDLARVSLRQLYLTQSLSLGRALSLHSSNVDERVSWRRHKEERKKKRIKSLHGNNAITVTCYRRVCCLVASPPNSKQFCVYVFLCSCKVHIPPHWTWESARLSCHTIRILYFLLCVSPLRGSFQDFFYYDKKCWKWITAKQEVERKSRAMPHGEFHIFSFIHVFLSVLLLLLRSVLNKIAMRSSSVSFWNRSTIARRRFRRDCGRTQTPLSRVGTRKISNFPIVVVIVWWMVKCWNIFFATGEEECGTCCKSLKMLKRWAGI